MSRDMVTFVWTLTLIGAVLGVGGSVLGGFVIHRGALRAAGGIATGALLGTVWALAIGMLGVLGLMAVAVV